MQQDSECHGRFDRIETFSRNSSMALHNFVTCPFNCSCRCCQVRGRADAQPPPVTQATPVPPAAAVRPVTPAAAVRPVTSTAALEQVTSPALRPVTSPSAVQQVSPPPLVSLLPLYLHGTLCTMSLQLCNVMPFQAERYGPIEMTSSEDDLIDEHDNYAVDTSADDSSVEELAPDGSRPGDLSRQWFNSSNDFGLDDGNGNIPPPLVLHQGPHVPQEPPDNCPMTSSSEGGDTDTNTDTDNE
jgi:hypothetical protein